MKNKEQIELEEESAITLQDAEPKNKKRKRFSVKEFRKSLKSENISEALKQFHDLCLASNKEHHYILEYLEGGGSCLELLQLMEIHTDVCHLILEIVYLILLEITSKYPQYTANAHEACRYFLSTYITMTNKMISLNSTRSERIAVLRFLTAVVALSPNFAKDILIHVNINSTNLGFLTNIAYSKDAVRYAFINFLMAFLIDGYYPTISALLEKRGLLTSILKGLAHDDADTVCVVINTLKTHVLENPLVSKTVKMRTFSTPVVKDIVQLYNWKGPVQKQKNPKKKKTEDVVISVDPHLKAKVSDSVHDFLLILCTSNRYGVIFKDPQLGMGKKTQNSLIYTVLDSLDTPWKHSYASELVIKICGACPDLTKTIWANLKPSLEPRRTEQWLCALKFVERLLKELEPNRIEYAVKELTPHQLAQITQILVAPTQIIKTLTTDEAFNDKYLKYQLLRILMQSLEAIQRFLQSTKGVLSTDDYITYNNLIREHLDRNFPDSTILLTNYKVKDESVNDFDYLNVVFEILSIYQRICPQLLDFTNSLINFKKILEYTNRISQESGILQMKIIKLYLDQDPLAFLPNTELLEQVAPYIINFYCISQDDSAFEALEKIFLITEVFESCENEVRIWIGSLTNLTEATEGVKDLFVNVLRLVFEKSMLYFSELSEIKANLPEKKEEFDLSDLIEQLCNSNNTADVIKPSPIKHTRLSPFILALFEYLSNTDVDKALSSFLNYAFLNLLHAQTDSDVIFYLIRRNDCGFLNKNVLKYFESWNNSDSEPILMCTKGKLELLSTYSRILISGDVTTFLERKIDSAFDISNLLYMTCFYVANLAKQKRLDQNVLKNCLEFMKFCVGKNVYVNILEHPVLYHYFSPLHIEKENSTHALMTSFLSDIVKETKQNETVLEQYREKLHNSLQKMFRKAEKFKDFKQNSFMNVLNVVGLNTAHSFLLLERLKDFDVENMLSSENTASIFVYIMTYLLNMLNNLGKCYETILDESTIEAIASKILFLVSKNENLDINSFVKSFSVYLEQNPHCIDYISKELVVSILRKEEYNKECVDLTILLLQNRFDDLFVDVMENIDKIISKKGVILPILEITQTCNVAEDNLKTIYDKIEHILHKSLQKPQKAGQHFEKYYKGVEYLVNKFFTLAKYKNYVEKIQKFEVTEIFHVYILKTVFLKALNENKNFTSNTILTYVHLCLNFFKRKTKNEEDWIKFESVIVIIKGFFENLPLDSDTDCAQVMQNESFKMFCKFCLKFGLAEHPILLGTLSVLIRRLEFPIEDLGLILEMTASHSEFLEWVLNEESASKTEILNLMFELFKRSRELMSKQYMPILLAAYRATLSKSDRIVFTMLKMFENSPSQTGFYDFNPFLWGKSAANHYSIRSDIQKALWRQPRIGSVLDILEEHRVVHTINKYPLNLPLDSENVDLINNEGANSDIYDLTFLIPLFTLLLAPENAVQTYRFTKSGALSLTIAALSSDDENTRSGACFVLSRLYHHVEARQSGKDNQLWLRFIEAICKGLATMDEEELKLNKFASIFLARMALVLTQPTHIMYVPLSQYLLAKSTLDFSTIPELYTLLHSSDVNFKEHRNFILEILRDGLISASDFHVALRSFAFKLIMEQYNSVLSDSESRLLILQVIERATRLDEGHKLLCSSYGLLSWLHHVVLNMKKADRKLVLNSYNILYNILYNIVNNKENVDIFVITLLLGDIIDDISHYNLTDELLLIFLRIVCITFKLSSNWLNENRLKVLISTVDCKEPNYILKYGSKYIKFDLKSLILTVDDVTYYIKFLTLSWLKINS